MQEALMPELETRCGNSECGAVVEQPWERRRKEYCSKPCTRRARELREQERCKDLVSKECRGCGEEKPIGEYRYPWTPHCKACMKERRRKQYEQQGGKDYVYAQLLASRYGMTMADYRERVAVQGGRCAICGDEPESGRLHVDHNHTTGAVRELLCRPCNHALGNAQDDPARLRAMIAYLERHS
ncbi:endonuclease VII domain-containing protein [Streptomyces koyangensis]|uniref:endonuclease VII domain-containing protein n=1 Tax=Streptomyces koyangensis TaxID=188770 RepID=UPI003C2C8CA3